MHIQEQKPKFLVYFTRKQKYCPESIRLLYLCLFALNNNRSKNMYHDKSNYFLSYSIVPYRIESFVLTEEHCANKSFPFWVAPFVFFFGQRYFSFCLCCISVHGLCAWASLNSVEFVRFWTKIKSKFPSFHTTTENTHTHTHQE